MSVGLTIAGVRKRFGTHQALAGVDLEIRPGEFFTLVGPSGCGKTTLLRCIAGFCQPDTGEIICDRERLDPLPPHQRNLGMVFQNYALFPHLTVRENVAYGLRARKAAPALIRERVERALAQVHLSHRADSFPGMLSGGEQQRVATARALAIEPRLLLMDEPLSNLDAKLRVEMRQQIRRMQRALGITTLYVTHDQEEALALSDRIAVMNAGHLEQIGDPIQIYSNPATPFVAGFVGHTNFLVGEVETIAQGRARVRLRPVSSQEAPAADECEITVAAYDLAPGQVVTVALRPERLSLEVAAGDNTLSCEIEEAVFLGAVTRLRVRSPAGPLTVDLHGHADQALQPGVRITLGFDPDAATVFAGAAN